MNPTPKILALETAIPKVKLSQEVLCAELARVLELNDAEKSQQERIFMGAAVESRYAVTNDFKRTTLNIHERNEVYKEHAPTLAEEAGNKALLSWGKDRSEISHIISVSCTGMYAPGLEYLLIDTLGLRRDIQRYGLNFMGCFGAIRGLALASALVQQNPNHKVLLLCTELCSLHLQREKRPEAYVSNALFADGAGAAIVGVEESALFELSNFHSYAIPKTLNEMTWEVSAHGFLMKLSRGVPAYLSGDIRRAVDGLLGNYTDLDGCDLAFHPGGKGILNSLAETLGIQGERMQASWDVLQKYGNMSSATLLFVLKALQPKKKWCASLAFGPGLSVEGMLLKKC
ncbi:MAG: type III polyketide synthase [Waddliaceae bacterium]